MAPQTKEVVSIILDSMNEINLQLDEKLSISDSEILFGKKSKLDSLGIINLLVLTEEMLNKKYPSHSFDLNHPEFIEQLFQNNSDVNGLAVAIIKKYF